MIDKTETIIDPDGLNSEDTKIDRPVDGEPIRLIRDDDDIPSPDNEPLEPIDEPTPDEPPRKYEEPPDPEKKPIDEPYMPLPTVI